MAPSKQEVANEYPGAKREVGPTEKKACIALDLHHDVTEEA